MTGRIAAHTRVAGRQPDAATSTGTSSEPSASPAIARPSCSPKTRARTSSRIDRWRIVRPATSTMARPAPPPTISNGASNADAGQRDQRQADTPGRRPDGRDHRQPVRPTNAKVIAPPSIVPARGPR